MVPYIYKMVPYWACKARFDDSYNKSETAINPLILETNMAQVIEIFT